MGITRKWLTIVAALIVQAAIWGFGLATFTLWANPWIRSFGASHGEIMAAIMLTQVATGFLGPVAGYLTEKLSLRLLMAAGTILFALSLCLVSRANAMWEVSALYALPIAMGMVVTGPLIGQILAVRLFQPHAGLAIGVVTLGLSVGGFLMPPIAAAVLAETGWRTSFVILAAGMCAFLLPLVFLGIREEPPSTGLSFGELPNGALVPAGEILGDRMFWGAVLIVFSLGLLFNAVYFNLGPWMSDMGNSREQTALVISLTAAVAALGTASFGALADRMDIRLLFLLALALNGGGMVVAAMGPGYVVLAIIIPLMGFATGELIPLLAAAMAARFGAMNFARANSFSLVFTTMAISGALLAGIGRDLLGSYPAAFALLLLALLPCIAGFLMLGASMREEGSLQAVRSGLP